MYYWCSEPGATGSDEAVSCGTFYNGILDVSFPGTEPTTDKISYTSTGGWDWDFNVWPKCYKVIRKINTMLPHIDDVPDMNAFDKMEFRARCRFLRAYAYYRILQNQGPMILVGDQVHDTNATPDYYQRERSTYDECVDYICSEPGGRGREPRDRTAARPLRNPDQRRRAGAGGAPPVAGRQPALQRRDGRAPLLRRLQAQVRRRALRLADLRRAQVGRGRCRRQARHGPGHLPPAYGSGRRVHPCPCPRTSPRPPSRRVRAASTPSAPTRKCSPARRPT